MEKRNECVRCLLLEKSEADYLPWKKDPIIRLDTQAAEVKRCAGFASMLTLLTFVFIVCNGSIKFATTGAVWCLTWLEERFLYF